MNAFTIILKKIGFKISVETEKINQINYFNTASISSWLGATISTNFSLSS